MLRIVGLIALGVALTSGCAGAPADDVDGSGVPIVFVHGLKGAELLDARGEVAWVTRAQALGLSSADLTLRPGDELRPGRVLRELFVVPKVIGETIYGPWLEALHASGRPIRVFTYDWRRDNAESLERLRELVRAVRAERGDFDLVGHSNGGLLVWALLAEGEPGVRRAVLAGVPLRGCIGFLPDLHDGAPVGLNARLLAPAVLASFPTVFGLFPTEPGDAVDPGGHALPLDFYSADSWREHRLGPDGLRPEVLEAARRFRARLGGPASTAVKIVVVAGDGRPTLGQVVWDGTRWDLEGGARVPGDGRVPRERALPQAGVPFQLLASKAEHSQLLNDPAVIAEVLGAKP